MKHAPKRPAKPAARPPAASQPVATPPPARFGGDAFAGRSVLSVVECARGLRVSRQHVMHLIERGALNAIDLGVPGRHCSRQLWRVPVEALDQFVRDRASRRPLPTPPSRTPRPNPCSGRPRRTSR